MSFLDAYQGTAHATSSREIEAGGEEVRALASLIFQLTTHVNSFKRMVDTLGTNKDTVQLRTRLTSSRDSVQKMARETSTGLKELNSQTTDGSLSTNVKAYHAKLVKDFHGVLKEFQRAQRICLDRESMYRPHEEDSKNNRPPTSDGSSMRPMDAEMAELDAHGRHIESEPLLQTTPASSRQEVMQVDNELAYNDAIILEREQGINEIHEQIQEVNEIFQDLAILVNDQGAMLDDIEANIVRTAYKTKDAAQELKKADRSQRRSRNKMCCLMMFFLFVLLILFLVLIKT
mmetsp:Transcript_35185/g.76921  ORF Transcript_35185/g.76921 Transcript_35185/m.76921 type:complete len:289 (-) Transcript_35185:292-1158(-)